MLVFNCCDKIFEKNNFIKESFIILMILIYYWFCYYWYVVRLRVLWFLGKDILCCLEREID